ncbi:hypothetical protein [Brevibacterium litoralis]|uniref:hypothetical protein n=1 Tax=Brevibacterium litoralis TaxID=3138935 RepID=UPI0032EF3F4E
MSSPRRLLAGAAALGACAVLAGCAVANVRIKDGPGGPVGIGVQSTPGPAPEEEIEAQLPDVPDGYELETVAFPENGCPVPVHFARPETWSVSGQVTGSFARYMDANVSRDYTIEIQCDKPWEDTASEAVSASQSTTYQQSGSEIVVQRSGTLGVGHQWVFQTELADSEFDAGPNPTTVFGVDFATDYDGQLWMVSVRAFAPTEDGRYQQAVVAAIDHLSIADRRPVAPEWEFAQ